MRTWIRSSCLIAALTFFLLSPSLGKEVCRSHSFEGMSSRTEQIKQLLGPDTTDLKNIKLFISKDRDTIYIQSNFLSEDPDIPGTRSTYPTKLRSKNIHSLDQALQNVIFWDRLPDNADPVVDEAEETVEIYVDREIVGPDGRIDFDLSNGKNIHLATDRQSIPTGELDLLTLRDPPPSITERIVGCCLRGRPPGSSRAITEFLRGQPVSKENVIFLPLVLDSGTNKVIKQSKNLHPVRSPDTKTEPNQWNTILLDSMSAARGKTLVILGHISGDNVVVERPNGDSVYSISIRDLKSLADSNGTSLLLFGCNTAASVEADTLGIGVVGVYNTATAARRIDEALEHSTNAETFLAAVSSPELTFVAAAPEAAKEVPEPQTTAMSVVVPEAASVVVPEAASVVVPEAAKEMPEPQTTAMSVDGYARAEGADSFWTRVVRVLLLRGTSRG